MRLLGANSGDAVTVRVLVAARPLVQRQGANVEAGPPCSGDAAGSGEAAGSEVAGIAARPLV